MNQVALTSRRLRGRSKIILGWLLLIVMSLVTLAVYQRSFYLSELKTESAQLFRIASQRIIQQEASMLALAVLVDSNVDRHENLFLQSASTTMRYAPRISEIQLIHLETREQFEGFTPFLPGVVSAIIPATKKSLGLITLMAHPIWPEHYLLIKRSPIAGKPLYALVMSIDVRGVLKSVSPFWENENIILRVTLPDNSVLLGPDELKDPQFSQTLDSFIQPLHLDISRKINIADLFPPLKSIVVILSVSLFYLLFLLVLWQRKRTKIAENIAKISKVETQLTHASRVNSMGEMASGMAHELTQPVTAILAQSQAGLRLLEQGHIDKLGSVFQDTVLQSRRAASILERLRNWSRPQRDQAFAIDLSSALTNVNKLLTSKAKQQGVQIRLNLPKNPAMVLANQVEMEQVIYNLIDNALEALDGVEHAKIEVSLKVVSGQLVLDISDNGLGVPPDIIPQLFTPFYTTRENGTGLGLTLCQRLVERAHGEITYIEGDGGATFRVTLPLVSDNNKKQVEKI